MARPAFDYDPNSDEALAAAQAPVSGATDFAMLPSVNEEPNATVPTQSDYIDELNKQHYGYAADAMLADEVARYEAEQAAQEQADMEAAFRQTQTPAGQNAIAVANARTNQANLANSAFETVQVPSRPNPIAPIAREHGALRMDLAGQQHNAAVGTMEATVNAQAAEALAYKQEAARQQAQNDARQAELLRAQARREQAIESERTVMKAVQDASDRLAKTPDDDRGRYWSSRKWWQKAAWAISAIADGIRGLDPMGALNAAIEGDLADQRAARESRRGELGSQLEQLGAVRSIYSDLRNSLGDDEIAADSLRIARYEEAKTLLMAEQLANGVPIEMARQHEGILELDQRINDLVELTRSRLAVMPERIGGGTRYAKPKEERAFLRSEASKEGDQARKLEAGGIEQGYAAETQARGAQYDIQKERAKVGAEAGAQAGKMEMERRKKILENSDDWGVVEQMIDEWEQRNTGNIHGTGIPLTGTREQRIENDSFDTLLPQMAIKAITGANFSEAQGKAAERLVEGSWTEMSDDAKRARIRSLKNLAGSQRRYAARLLGEEGTEPLNQQPVVQGPEGFTTFQPE